MKGRHMKKFELGRIFATPGAIEAMGKVEVSMIEILGRHQGGDWSEMEKEDRDENEFALDKPLRIFSSYSYNGMKFWVITEADRSATTILLPGEY